ncbi:MAG: WYL domain-containing protein, partial [Ktedonobacterales bacterium]
RFTPPAGAPPRPTAATRAVGMTLEARILFDAVAARWAREAPSFFTAAQESTADGGLLVTLRLRQMEDVTQWLLGWGSHVRVLEPPALRQRIAGEAAALLRAYQPD